MPVIAALGGLREEEDCKCEASLGYIANSTPGWDIEQDLVTKTKQKPGRVAHEGIPSICEAVRGAATRVKGGGGFII